jgi:hypothetical protein
MNVFRRHIGRTSVLRPKLTAAQWQLNCRHCSTAGSGLKSRSAVVWFGILGGQSFCAGIFCGLKRVQYPLRWQLRRFMQTTWKVLGVPKGPLGI